MRKTIEATWREGFFNPDALVAPKVNNLDTRKSSHIVDRIQRMQRINEIAIVLGAPIRWVLLSAVGIPYTGAIICTVCAEQLFAIDFSTVRIAEVTLAAPVR